MQMTQKNIRMSAKLQQEGDAVLDNLGYGTSEVVRMLWSYLAKHKRLPKELLEEDSLGSGGDSSWRNLVEDSASLACRVSGVEAGASLDSSFYTSDGYKRLLYDEMLDENPFLSGGDL